MPTEPSPGSEFSATSSTQAAQVKNAEESWAQKLEKTDIPGLIKLLSDPDHEIRSSAACCLGDKVRTKELREFSHKLKETLAQRLKDPSGQVRFEAAIALAEMQDIRATGCLASFLPKSTHRLDAIRSLGASGDTLAIVALKPYVERWWYPWADRLQAAAALCRLGNSLGMEYLQDRITCRRREEKCAAYYFLGESNHPEALSLLQSGLKSGPNHIKHSCIDGLGALATPQAWATLQKISDDAQGEVQEHAQEILNRAR
ncbi:MAG: HEAT repeat domain-containing protein [Myxococcota bacterium]|nr:HEAT repeat domain-containing protein [Myxococcota bacterium]